jgi:hypothetical protein
MSTALRSKEGISLYGYVVTAPLLARYLRRLGLNAVQIAALLEPHDAQNVPAAIDLVKKLEEIANLSTQGMDSSEHQDLATIRAFSNLFGSFVKAYTDLSLSLSDQMSLLAKYALMGAWFYRRDTTRFLPNQLYIDSMTCIKNAYICLAKQKILDPRESFFLILLGTDCVEQLFACARMIGGHNPNFGLYTFALLLGMGLDINRVLDNNPKWHVGHRRLNTSRGESADHLRPKHWKGNVVAGDVDLKSVWDTGCKLAADAISNATGVRPDWDEFFKIPKSDILRPCGTGYPGVVLLDLVIPTVEDASGDRSVQSNAHFDARSMLRDFPEQEVNEAIAVIANTAEANQHDSPECTDSLTAQPEQCINDLLNEDGSNEQPLDVPDNLELHREKAAEHRAHCILSGGKLVPIQSAVRILFNTHPQPKQSKDRLQRVRTWTPPTVASNVRLMPDDEDAFHVGYCVGTLLRCGESAYLAIMRVTHLQRGGQDVYSVRRSEIAIHSAKIHIRGQVLAISATSRLGSRSWTWKGATARLRHAKSTSDAGSIRLISIPGAVATPVSLPSPQNSDDVDSVFWELSEGELNTLRSALWQQIGVQHSSKLAVCGTSADFPYQSLEGTDNITLHLREALIHLLLGDLKVFREPNYTPPPDDSVRHCMQCQKNVPGKEILSHIGRHILLRKRGVVDTIHPDGIAVCSTLF